MAKDQPIVLVDDDADLRDAVCDLFTLFGARCLAFSSLKAMIAAAPEVLAAELVILDVNLGENQPTGVDARDWLIARAFAGRIVFLTGHAQSHPAVRQAQKLGVPLLAKPIEADELRSLVADQSRDRPHRP